MENKELLELINDDNFCPNDDLPEIDPEAWDLEEFGELNLIEMIREMPKLDDIFIYHSQYAKKEHTTACTIFSGMNAKDTSINYSSSKVEIENLIDFAKARGWKGYPYGWNRFAGWDTNRRLWNQEFGENIFLFSANFGSPEVEEYLNKGGCLGISITVDSAFWKEARTGKVSGKSYKKDGGHATVLIRRDGKYYILDSVSPSNNKNVGLKYEIEHLEDLMKSGNIRRDISLFIFSDWLKPSEEEIERLEDFLLIVETNLRALETIAENNSKLWHLTTQAVERDWRHQSNNQIREMIKYEDAKIRIIKEILV